MSEDLRRTMDAFFSGFGAKKAEPSKPSDAPDIKAFMAQIVRQYASLAEKEPLEWRKSFREKQSGAVFKVTVTLSREAT